MELSLTRWPLYNTMFKKSGIVIRYWIKFGIDETKTKTHKRPTIYGAFWIQFGILDIWIKFGIDETKTQRLYQIFPTVWLDGFSTILIFKNSSKKGGVSSRQI